MARRSSAQSRARKAEAKKARRRKRKAARDATWLPDETMAAVADTTDVEAMDAVLTARGWEFDIDNSSDELVSWFFAASGIVTDDEAVETVTRIWLTTEDEWHVILVGSGPDGIAYVFSAESLLANLDAVENFRAGDPAPVFA